MNWREQISQTASYIGKYKRPQLALAGVGLAALTILVILSNTIWEENFPVHFWFHDGIYPVASLLTFCLAIFIWWSESTHLWKSALPNKLIVHFLFEKEKDSGIYWYVIVSVPENGAN